MVKILKIIKVYGGLSIMLVHNKHLRFFFILFFLEK